LFDATFTAIKQSRKLCNKGSKIMQQQQIKAENTVQSGSLTRSYYKKHCAFIRQHGLHFK
jgi:hypothetical protein